MKTLRALEAVSAALASLTGLAVLTWMLIVPSYSGETFQSSSTDPAINCTPTSITLLEINGAGVVISLAIFALLLLGVGVAGIWHSRTNAPSAQAALWIFAASLTAFALLAILSIGPFLLPSVVLALVACALSVGYRRPAPA